MRCRAGAVTSRYYGSALDLLPKYAWFQKSSGNKAWPVGQLKPNDFGLFDILGNAWEWCQESWEKGEERKKQAIGTDTEDLGPVTDRKDRITRGGSFTFPDKDIRCASRNSAFPIMQDEAIGFRIARTIR